MSQRCPAAAADDPAGSGGTRREPAPMSAAFFPVTAGRAAGGTGRAACATPVPQR
ncbi:hypothetical protein ACFXG1_04975 [Streptomyces sp. NPDC059248]|uniref:hypothetical protein n=1 Tax=Streptomyces sp. NPDC059248 TaxID=3346791 RepID=UPI0036A3FCF5